SRMGIEDRRLVARRRFHAVQRIEGFVVEHTGAGAQPVGPLWVPRRRQVLEIDRMRIEPRGPPDRYKGRDTGRPSRPEGICRVYAPLMAGSAGVWPKGSSSPSCLLRECRMFLAIALDCGAPHNAAMNTHAPIQRRPLHDELVQRLRE